jgi:hypothetical protein
MLAYNTTTNEVTYFSSVMLPYLYGTFNQSTAAGPPVTPPSFSINFTNGASLDINAYFTLRCQIEYTYNDSGSGTINPYYDNYQFLMDVWPNRVPAISSLTPGCFPSGIINGNGGYVMTDATYAPSGRWYWIRNYSNSVLPGTSPTTTPFYFDAGSQSSVIFVLNSPSTASCTYTVEATVEIVNRAYGTSFTSSKVRACFSTGSYASF